MNASLFFVGLASEAQNNKPHKSQIKSIFSKNFKHLPK